ncbi:hypothetical protein L4D09_08900 [Photobacterium makurazakiensis]|uniref:hypothetical protein n=1 Tax=Photobacterium makurazakiensis TaxID=2910234 RepID=UPI003D11E81A
MDKLLTSKFNHWFYEDEHRVFVDLEPLKRENGLYFKEFDSSIQLKDVYIGHLCSVDKQTVLNLIGEHSSPIRAVKVRPDFKSFKIVIDQRST